MQQEVHDLFTEFMSTLDFVLETCPKEGCHSLEKCYLSWVTMVVIRGASEMRSLLFQAAVAG